MSANTTTDRPTPTATPLPPVRRRPGPAGYWLGGIVAILATLGAIAWGTVTFLGWQSHVQDFPRLTSAGTATVQVTDPGTRVVYLEHDRATAVPAAPAITVTGPSGAAVLPTAPRGELRYDVPDDADRIGDAVLTFPADEAGSYLVTVAALDQGATVAVGDDMVSGWAPQVAGALAVLVGGMLLALVIVVVTAARRGAPMT